MQSNLNTRSVARGLVGFAILLLTAIATIPASAATITMTTTVAGCPNLANWSTTTCWDLGRAPVTGDDVVIGQSLQTPAQTNYDLGSSVQLHSITLNSANNSVTITGGPIVLQSGGFITNNWDAGGPFGSLPGITLNGPATFTHATSFADRFLGFSGAITGTGPLTLTNNGTNDNFRITVASSYTGATTISGTARVRADVNGAIPTGSALTVHGSLLFQAASTIGSLAGGGNVFMNGNNTLTVGGDNTSTTFSGVYQNSGGNAALTKTGTGTLTLSGANTYTGATTVNAGTLLVNGSTASPSTVTVASGATLGGSGTINGSVTLSSGGQLAPGNSIGTLSVGSSLLWNGSSGAPMGLFELSNTNATSDQVAVGGALAKGTAGTFKFDFQGTGHAATYTLATFGVVTTFSATDFSYTNLAPGFIGSFAIINPFGPNGQLQFAVVAVSPPAISKAFGAASIPLGGTTALTFTLSNPNASTPLTGVGFMDTLPAGLTVANGTSTVCGGTLTTSGSNTITLAGATIAASGSCVFPVTVTGTTAGVKNNTTGPVTSNEGGAGGMASASITVLKAATNTAVSSSVNPSDFGQTVTFTATVTSAAGTPTGTVQFKDGGANLGAPQTLNGSGMATFSTSSLSAGVHTITADYGGDTNFLASSGTLSGGQQVGSIIQFSASNYNTTENSGFTTITVQRTGDLTQAVAVDYSTPDDSSAMTVLPCSTANGVAFPRCDFETALGTLRWAAGDGTARTFTVLINQDRFVEGPETLTLTLSNPTGGAGFTAPGATSLTATLTIADDATEPATNPIDDTDTFVRQHYRDFLNREPDASGLQFWKDNIDKCNDPARRPPGLTAAQCIEVFRINTSAAFFLSIEFQNTGYLVERLYKASYADATGTSLIGGAHQLTIPIVKFSEFLPDTQTIAQGLVVGQTGWETVLENNKQAFTAEFVTRSRFTTAYANTLTPAQFVDMLFANAGVVPTSTERQAAIDEFGGAATSANAAARGRALRRVAENSTLAQQEFNRAFVLIEYFGYLRRNPNAAPDSDFSGYDFWLTKLNNFTQPGDDVLVPIQKAEMVKAFINSSEYRQRFGP